MILFLPFIAVFFLPQSYSASRFTARRRPRPAGSRADSVQSRTNHYSQSRRSGGLCLRMLFGYPRGDRQVNGSGQVPERLKVASPLPAGKFQFDQIENRFLPDIVGWMTPRFVLGRIAAVGLPALQGHDHVDPQARVRFTPVWRME
jgi:hypothetical protein